MQVHHKRRLITVWHLHTCYQRGKRNNFRFKLFSTYHTESVRIIRSSLRKAHTHIWSSRCLKWADGEHVGPFRTPGLGRPFKQNVCLLEKKKREEAELPPGGYVPLSARWGTARRLAGRREIPKVKSTRGVTVLKITIPSPQVWSLVCPHQCVDEVRDQPDGWWWKVTNAQWMCNRDGVKVWKMFADH